MSAPTAPPAPPAPAGREPPYSPPPSSPQPPRRPYAAALLLIGIGVLWALALVGIPIEWRLVLPGALIAVGGALLLDRRAPAGGLVALGIALLVFSLIFLPLTNRDGAEIGERQRVVTDVAELEDGESLGIGQLVLDLRGLDLEDGEVVSISASVGIGELRVRIGDDVSLTGEARAGIGSVTGPSESRGGFGVRAGLEDAVEPTASDPPVLDLDLEVGIGQVTVSR
jgi:hypothetical protein